MCNKFLSRLDAKVPGVYSRAEVEEERRLLCRKILGAEGLLVIFAEGFEMEDQCFGKRSSEPMAFANFLDL